MPHHALPSPTLLSSGQEATVAPAWGSERPGEWRLFAQLSGVCVQSCALISRKHGAHCLPALGPGRNSSSGALIRPSLIKSGSSGGHHPSPAPHGLRSPRGARKSDRIPISGAPTPGRPGSLQRLPRSGPIPARSALSPSLQTAGTVAISLAAPRTPGCAGLLPLVVPTSCPGFSMNGSRRLQRNS